jgi:CBS domain-containing protein
MSEAKVVGELIKNRDQVLEIDPSTSVAQAAKIMTETKVGCLLVVAPNGRVAGILSERDIVRKVVSAGKDPNTTTVAGAMTEKIIAVSPRTTLTRALEVMDEYNIRHLPVIADGKPVGVVSIRDILADKLCHTIQVLDQNTQVLREIKGKCPGINCLEVDRAGRILVRPPQP